MVCAAKADSVTAAAAVANKDAFANIVGYKRVRYRKECGHDDSRSEKETEEKGCGCELELIHSFIPGDAKPHIEWRRARASSLHKFTGTRTTNHHETCHRRTIYG